MTSEEIQLNITIESINIPKKGGQSCGLIYSGRRLICKDLDIRIECGWYRSAIKNDELLKKLIETAVKYIMK